MRPSGKNYRSLEPARRRWPLCALALLALAGSAARAEEAAAATTDAADEANFFSRVRQLTFEGRRAGEGYFAADGKRLVFQSERQAGNPFYQIYELDFESGETRRISPGRGKTTCAYFHSSGEKLLFASTHHDPRSEQLQQEELALRERGEERRYAWDYDPEMEIYEASGDALLRLTHERGYDAEGSYSPDGNWIVFASTRDAYARELDDDERRRLELDPSYFAEIFLMRADGSEPRRLTHTAGYDGGPFFSHDGTKIIWRRFDAEGLIADIWEMRLDGSAQRALTDFGSMSWAPFPHPSGEYVIFTSNKLGFENFELFIVDSAGTREPVRVTYSPGFDGLPVPSPDGRRIAWTTTRRQDGGGAQIFLADWDHDRALEALDAAPLRGAADGKDGTN